MNEPKPIKYECDLVAPDGTVTEVYSCEDIPRNVKGYIIIDPDLKALIQKVKE